MGPKGRGLKGGFSTFEDDDEEGKEGEEDDEEGKEGEEDDEDFSKNPPSWGIFRFGGFLVACTRL